MQAGNPSLKFSVKEHLGHSVDEQWMRVALEQAELARAAGEVPIGAVLVLDGKSIGAAHNAPVSNKDACAHAEIQAIQQACKSVDNYRLGSQSTLYVTLQPCLMCLGAILHARIGRVVVGCAQSRYNGDLAKALAVFEQAEAWHPCRFETGCLSAECEQVLTAFFKARRKQREQSVAALADLMHLPNVNKDTLAELARMGFQSPADFLNTSLEALADQLAQRSLELKNAQATQQAAILASLCDYFKGEPVRSWKLYL